MPCHISLELLLELEIQRGALYRATLIAQLQLHFIAQQTAIQLEGIIAALVWKQRRQHPVAWLDGLDVPAGSVVTDAVFERIGRNLP